MFTGIIEHVGTILACGPRAGDMRLVLDLGPLAGDARLGDSIAVDGICLTICALAGSRADFDLSPETQRRTTAGGWTAGRAVNLERALRLGDRLGGHLVSGHVDGLGTILDRQPEGGGERFRIGLPPGLHAVEKGSLAVDGISLTTWDCREGGCSIAVIPHTLERTTLSQRRAGDRVNLEQDQIGRWVASLIAR